MSHPYKKYENTDLWKVVHVCINELLENQDLDLTTKEEYVVGYICKSIDEKILKSKVEKPE